MTTRTEEIRRLVDELEAHVMGCEGCVDGLQQLLAAAPEAQQRPAGPEITPG